MTDETTTEQLAEIEGQGEVTPATEYTPPDGWRVLPVGEALREGDERVQTDESRYATRQVGRSVQAHERYIRPIEPEPQPEPQPEPESDAELRIRLLKQANDSQAETIGRLLSEARDLNMEIGGLERQLLQRDARIRDVETMHATAAQAVVDAGKVNDKLRAQAEELRSEVSYVQNLLGESRQRVTQLEELVASLRTINVTQEKAFTAAGRENTALKTQLAAVKAELVTQAETSRRLQIELDAAQQVPQAVSDRFEEGWDAGTARAVETIAEWTEPFRRCGSERLAWMVMQNLPHIMRTLTGLTQED